MKQQEPVDGWIKKTEWTEVAGQWQQTRLADQRFYLKKIKGNVGGSKILKHILLFSQLLDKQEHWREN